MQRYHWGKDIDVEELNKENFFSGTPADCSYFGLHGSKKFDFTQLVSGINLGSNLGTDFFYSGTVGAAIAGPKSLGIHQFFLLHLISQRI
ncbi:MAG: hypothetical protein CM15mP104_4460 [Gammaproteobacteria bacterium]|nr:MAG: hypothetical protein CM15mP104_4460 [Gammaproteobacteria bacterium]